MDSVQPRIDVGTLYRIDKKKNKSVVRDRRETDEKQQSLEYRITENGSRYGVQMKTGRYNSYKNGGKKYFFYLIINNIWGMKWGEKDDFKMKTHNLIQVCLSE